MRRTSIHKQLTPDLLVHLAFVGLVILSIIYYHERLYADSGYYLFRVINEMSVWIEHQRLVLALSQLAPLAAVHMGLPLHFVLVLYSVAHVGFHYLIFLVARYKWNNRQAGPMLILLQVLGLSYGFFTPMFEWYYGSALLVLFWVLIQHERPRGPLLLGAGLLLLLILGSHPMAFVLLGLLAGLHYLSGKDIARPLLIMTLSVVCLMAIVKVAFASHYEEARTAQVIQVVRENPLGIDYWVAVLGLLCKHYHAMLLLLLVNVFVFVHKRKGLLAIFTIAATVVTVILAALQNYGIEHTRYQEQAYFTIAAFVGFTTIGYAWPLLPRQWKIYLAALLLLISGYRMVKIQDVGQLFAQRTATMLQLIERAHQTHEGQKFIIEEAVVTSRISPDPNWSYPIETLLFSSELHDQRSISICLDSDFHFGDHATSMKDDEYLFRRWERYPVSQLNGKYFSLGSGPYVWLNQAQPPDSIATYGTGITLHSGRPEAHARSSDILNLPIEIRNSNPEALPASSSRVFYLSYHIYRQNTLVQWDGVRTPILLDVTDAHQQYLEIQAPAESGHYQIVPDIVAEHIAWLNTQTDTIMLRVR